MLQEGSFPNLADSRTHVTLFVGVLCKAMISHAKPVNFQHKGHDKSMFCVSDLEAGPCGLGRMICLNPGCF